MPGFPQRALTTAEIESAMDGRLHLSAEGRVDAFLPSPMVQNHAANLHFLPDGRLACVWFGGTMEGMGDISIWMSVLEGGGWSAARRLSDDPGRSEQNPVLFNAPDGKVWLFHTSQPGGRQDECEILARISQDGGESFGPAQRLGDFRGIFVRQPLQIGAQGEWLLPCFRCVTPPAGRWAGDLDSAVMLRSLDGGASWQVVDVSDSLGAVHMNPVAAHHPHPMAAFYRDRYAQWVKRSLSLDGGASWSAPKPTDLPNNNSSIQATRLADGRIAMVLNPISAAQSDARRLSLYDEIEDEAAVPDSAVSQGGPKAIWGVPRAPMTLALSQDNGASFPRRIHLDDGSGHALSNNSAQGINQELSYPSILQDPDGSLHIAYTYHRRAIRYLRIDCPDF